MPEKSYTRNLDQFELLLTFVLEWTMIRHKPTHQLSVSSGADSFASCCIAGKLDFDNKNRQLVSWRKPLVAAMSVSPVGLTNSPDASGRFPLEFGNLVEVCMTKLLFTQNRLLK